MGTERPTILQIIPRLDAGGAELAVVEIAAAVTGAGGRALVLAELGRLAPRVEAAGGEVTAFPAATKNPARMLSNASAIARFIAEEGVDLVHARSRAPAWSALIAARRTGVPFVTTYHGAYQEAGPIKRLYNSVMARGDVVIANSRYTARLIAERYATPEERIAVIPRGVDTETFDPGKVSTERVAALRRRWGIEPSTRVILHAARLTSWKGQNVVIDAAGQLATAGRLGPAVVILAGDAQGRDDYQEGLRAQIERLGLKDRVRLVGHVEDVAAAYLTAHVTIVASTGPEAFGRSAIEAAAMQCPVIATNIGAPPETVRAEPAVPAEATTGWLVAPGDARALAARLAEALDLPQEARAALGARARRHVLAQFATQALQRRTLAVYDRLLGTVLERHFLERSGQRNPPLKTGQP
ncbi:MAG: glycosyltransferase family 4 protein [Hyphomicrobiaceae bacterium]|nr:MAG: glycosyltransferase family 4 protein [Hyphomicrobiaceae bacterium]